MTSYFAGSLPTRNVLFASIGTTTQLTLINQNGVFEYNLQKLAVLISAPLNKPKSSFML